MAKQIARCICTNYAFEIYEDKVICSLCGKEYPFSFICEGVCETKANDLTILINEGY